VIEARRRSVGPGEACGGELLPEDIMQAEISGVRKLWTCVLQVGGAVYAGRAGGRRGGEVVDVWALGLKVLARTAGAVRQWGGMA